MSNRNRLLVKTPALATLVCGILFSGAVACGQSQGFSIFEPPSEDKAPVVSPKEAFTNPKVNLPKAQFGSFERPKAESAPKLQGSKAVGTYAHQGPEIFKQVPDASAAEASKLKPFAANSLRPQQRPQHDNSIVAKSTPPPVVVGDFQKSARRLPAEPKVIAPEQTAKPKIAQVAFQDGGFKPQGQGVSNRFSAGANGPSRFSAGASQAQTPSSTSGAGGAARPFGQRTLGASQSTTPATQPTRRTQPAVRQQPSMPAIQPRNNTRKVAQPPAQKPTFPAARTQNTRAPLGTRSPLNTPRVAFQNQPTPTRRTVAGVEPTTTKSKPKSAKELLVQWAKKDTDKKTPGKALKLHEFLARPINGSRKDAINQYWVTYADLARKRLADEHVKWLGAIQNPQQPAERAILNAAQQQAEMRVMQTDLQLAKSQFLLGEFMPNFRSKSGQIIPVLPSSTPWVGKWNARLKEYQRRGIVPAQFSGIDNYLVKAKKLIASEAEAVVASGEAAEQARSAMRSGQTSIANVLEAMRIKERNEEEFLASVLGYNRAITDYVLSVRQDIYQPKRLASVLIGRKSVEPTLAKVEKPQEDVDAAKGVSSKPKLQQVSAIRKRQSSKSLPGKSAYQNDAAAEEDDDQSNSVLNASSSSTAKTKPTKSAFEYGPTKKTAAASNFDPAKLKEERPMQQAKPAAASSYQTGGPSTRTPNGGRVSNAGVRAPRGMSRNEGLSQPRVGAVGQGGFRGQPFAPQTSGAPRGTAANSAVGNNQNAAQAGGRFSPQNSGLPAADTTPKIPQTNPFSESAAVKPTTGASNGSRLGGGGFGGGSSGGTLGGGTFNAPTRPEATASRFAFPGANQKR